MSSLDAALKKINEMEIRKKNVKKQIKLSMQKMDLYSQLQALNQEDGRIKEDEFDKLNKMSAGILSGTGLNNKSRDRLTEFMTLWTSASSEDKGMGVERYGALSNLGICNLVLAWKWEGCNSMDGL